MNKRVMIIDDDLDILNTMRDILGKESLSISTFSDPLDALKEIKTKKYDLFVIDLYLPKVNGISLLKTIKKLQKPAHCIIITGYGDNQNIIDAFKAGAEDFILKPFTAEVITERILNQLEEKGKLDDNLKKWGTILESTGIPDFSNILDKLDFSTLSSLDKFWRKIKRFKLPI